MRRKYKYQLGVYQNTAVSDTFGGNTVTESQLGSSWAGVETISASRQVAFGLDINKQTVRFTMRWRDDIDYTDEGVFFKYRSKDWLPLSVREIDQFKREVEVIAINVTIDNMPDITYVPVGDGEGPLLIDNFFVKKGSGNTLTDTIEVGDQVYGFIGTTAVAGTVNTVPVTLTSHIDLALEGDENPF